ncbi:MAG TPA: acyltransferase family protein [Mycolicibacillus parakoreensis]|uniref:Acyltransferase n=1 Tax=Mycolicibacillus parakoreensis TaxID=1069221 RepID=A0ABY3UAA9_9MYCO|nr:acyltransferase family protein [Mycolicibacillus parakoreensis]ULN54403.1 acyltransferase [Mycolicibacillus parakoreensis]HLR98662.1 acyltransferase family protein [Mycolicibacillus parakoreensis]
MGAGRQRFAHRSAIPALDGIRAIAVALVLLDHGGIPGLSGGFIGVDVFFVLSGFLITALLLDEIGRTDRIDVPGFWVRRARRLLPALVVMVLAVAFARDLFPPDAVLRLRDDAVAAFFWMANWNFVAQQSDYFTSGGNASPLQHTWSLGVEEQYYFLWPLLVIGVGSLVAARARRRRWVTHGTVRLAVLVVAGAGVIASATAAVLLAGHTSVDRIYFGTDTRVQALLLGAAAAALVVQDWSALLRRPAVPRSRWGTRTAAVLPVLGLAGLGAAAHLAAGTAEQFRWGALTAVAVAAVAVVAPVALHQRSPVARLLALRPLVALGAVSYGVYLWHWPIFLLLNGERTGQTGGSLFALRCAATLAVAIASWWLIEQPIRRWRPAGVPLLRLAAATVGTAVAVTLLVVPTVHPPGGPAEVSAVAAMTPASPASSSPAPSPLRHRDPHRPHTVSVFGDSIGASLMEYLPATPGVRFIDHTVIGCSIVRGGPYRYSGKVLDQKAECDRWPARWGRQLAADRPDVALLVIGRWETVNRVIEGNWTHIGDRAFDAYLEGELTRAVRTLTADGTRLVITTLPYSKYGEKPDGSLYPEDQPERVKQWNALLHKVVGKRRDVRLLDLNKKLGPTGRYTVTVDGVKVRSDGVHLSAKGVAWLTPWLVAGVR